MDIHSDTLWVKVGYTEKGQLVQINKSTKEIRLLDKWVEIFKTDELVGSTSVVN